MRLNNIIPTLATLCLMVTAVAGDERVGTGSADTAPWSIPTDPIVALRDPDRFAWQLFNLLDYAWSLARAKSQRRIDWTSVCSPGSVRCLT